jgi:hypothetical protein
VAKNAVAKRETTMVVSQRTREAMQREFPPLPEVLEGKIDCRGWLASVLGGMPYQEPDPDFMAREMLLNVFLTEDLNAALTGVEMDGLQDILDNYAGATTGPIRLTDLYVASSNLEDKDGTYVLLSWVSMEDGTFTRTTTGAGGIQIALLRYLAQGIWPIECQIVRDKVTDQGGRHLLKIWPLDAM